jgi:chorismate lyase / 3-hydroxybenzoate synthase
MMFSFAFGDPGDNPEQGLETAIPLLRGEQRETLMGAAEPAGREGSVSLWRGPDGLLGISRIEPAGDLEAATGRAYGDILRAARGLNLCRIWNIVPRINGAGMDGLENYRAFCRGRSLAFETGMGRDFMSSLPAASAIGSEGSELTVVFVAGADAPRHFENPDQVPAYLYPPEHGPRPPSFARATVVNRAGRLDAFISGTSSILGHSTVAPRDTRAQLACTLENLARISRASGLGDRLGEGGGGDRHFKVYLRSAVDLDAVAHELDRRLLMPGDRVSYLRADICRSELNVEIEVAVRGAVRS